MDAALNEMRLKSPDSETRARTRLLGMELESLSRIEVCNHMFTELREGRGGWLVTANLDILRRHWREPQSRALYGAADMRVADGMPLVWASQVSGAKLPERVAGSTLVWDIASRAAAEARSIYLLGGAPGAAEGCAEAFQARWPALDVCGLSSPMISSPITEDEEADLVNALNHATPDILLIGLGSPKQEYVAQRLRARFPRMWIVGVGISFSFVAGQVERAPRWMQRSGLEWVHRLAQEPGRLAKRYLVDDLPFAAVLFGHALWTRMRG